VGPWQSLKFRGRVEDLIGYLTSEGTLTDRVWRVGLHEVPRDAFPPGRAWAHPFEWYGHPHAIDRGANPTDWWNAVYGNYSIVTQRDDGRADVCDTSAEPTCTLSCPSISMTYLHLLDLAEDHQVLEIGTGTGWTAAMLAWRLGHDHVTTMEIDKDLAHRAVDNLRAVGQPATVVTGDGLAGHPESAPYDRIHVTCGIRYIPHAWIQQVRPGGTIVAPFVPFPNAGGHQLRLDVLGDGTAVGSFLGGGGFMMARSQRITVPGDLTGEASESTTSFDPRLIADADGGAQLALICALGDIGINTRWTRHDTGGTHAVELTARDGSAWATCTRPHAEHTSEYLVRQHGERRLWDQAQDAYLQWLRMGRPGRDAYTLTIDSHGEQRLRMR
jgi:protein-L-isoaspartate O-methyltransferase